MARGVPINAKDAEQAFRLVAEGKTLSEVATVVGVSYGGLHRALTETWPDEYAEAKQRRDDVIRNRVWAMGMQQSGQEVDAATTRWALDHLIRWHLPEARETQKLEITGQVAIAHEARLTLAHALAVGRVEGLEPHAGGLLSGPGEVLAELESGVGPADALPA